jgi:hypothetical protein
LPITDLTTYSFPFVTDCAVRYIHALRYQLAFLRTSLLPTSKSPNTCLAMDIPESLWAFVERVEHRSIGQPCGSEDVWTHQVSELDSARSEAKLFPEEAP